MADYNGAQSIGALLGGGAAAMKQNAFDEGRLNTAKTEDALANARLTQLKAKAEATKEREAANFEENYIATGGDPKEAALIGGLIRSGGGSDFYASTQGLGEVQEQGFRRTLADTEAAPTARLQAGSAIQGKQLPNLVPVGTHGIEDLLAPEKGLMIPPGGGNATTAVRNFEYSQHLPPDQRSAFSPFVRADQIVQGGGVPYVRQATTGATAPVVEPTQVVQNAGDVAQAKTTGQKIAVQKADYPMVRYTLEQNKLNIKAANDIAGEVYNDEKLWQTVGPTQLIAKVPGTEGAYLRSKLDTLRSKVMLQTLINLRAMSKTGGAVGNVSDREGAVMEKAIAAISDPNITAGDFRKELGRLIAYNAEFEKNLEDAFNATYDPQGNPIMTQAPRGTAGAEGEAGAIPQDGEYYTDEDDGQVYQYGGGPDGDRGDPENWFPVAQ